jgi:acyl-CoA dehydrogenase
MERTIFSEEHNIFRQAFRKFLDKEVVPYHEQWEKDGIVPSELYTKAGEQGFLCPWLPEELGGSEADFLYSVIITEECSYVQNSGFLIGLHNDVCAPYLFSFGNEEQKKRWLPKCASGESILSVAMTEPGAGSDLAGLRTTAIKDGDHYVLNGSKTFISNGICSNLVIVAAKTDPKADPPHSGMSLIVVEGDTPGFTRGRNLEKIGMHAQDTAELHFEDCRVPVENLLGSEGAGFMFLMQKLQQERIVLAIASAAAAEGVMQITEQYCRDREQFGKPIGKFQYNRFQLAEMKTEVEIGRVFVDRLIADHTAGKNILMETCMAKWWVTDMLKRLTDRGLQLHGGYGYMLEYPIAKAFLDARVQPIFAGTNEIMKELIGRQMGF